ncbi:MAG: hypothetical protein P8J86_09525 [Phycisphaerales bacterium]|nr:hypothetical protein [Phycisphaerales bacterium]
MASCAAPTIPATLTGTDSGARIRGILAARGTEDTKTRLLLIQQLDAGDPAVRFAAINVLSEITGDRMGYQYDEPRPIRRPAMLRWISWGQTLAPPPTDLASGIQK